jgi:hypothetical protein
MLQDYSYLGSGMIWLRVKGAAAPLLEVGNCSALSFNITEEPKELKDFTKPGGGTYTEVRRIGSVEMSITAHDMSPQNLAIAHYGTASTVVTGPVTGELHTLYRGGLVPLVNIPTSAARTVEMVNGAAAVARANETVVALNAYLKPVAPNGFYYKVTTAGTTDDTPPAFPTTPGLTVTDGTAVLTCMGRIELTGADFSATPAGLRILDDAAVTDGEQAGIDYTKANSDVVEALTKSGQEYELVFEGLNEARSGKAVVVVVHRGKIGAAQQTQLIGEEFVALTMTGKVLKDTSIVGEGLSQYFVSKLAA